MDVRAPIIVPAAILAERVEKKLLAAGADAASSASTVRALMHGSLRGVDSHGVRLTGYYCTALKAGQVNGRPDLKLRRTAPGSAMLDGDNGLGHHASYEAMRVAVELAREAGIGAVGVTGSSHYGAAGAYVLAAAEAGMVGFATTNSESYVALHGGREAFHGTNPLAFAAPVPDEAPWLLDMATSSIPFNRVLLYRSLGHPLPEAVALDATGNVAHNADNAVTLMPLGGEDYSFKGAALAGVATLFSAILTGARLDHEMALTTKSSGEISTKLGHFFFAVNPQYFAGGLEFASGMRRYLDALRLSPVREGSPPPMAPGDREWRVAMQRERDGIPIDRDTADYLGM